MLVVYCVYQFMREDIVLNTDRSENQPPVETHRPALVLAPETIEFVDFNRDVTYA